MFLIRYIKIFINYIFINKIQLLHKLFNFFVIVVLLSICQILGLLEIIQIAHAITLNENFLDYPIPLEFNSSEDSISIQRNETNFYQEIPDDTPPLSVNTTLLPNWCNQETAECTGFLVGLIGGIAVGTYIFILMPGTRFNCAAYIGTINFISRILNRLF